jgi:hypothetical protein
VNSLDEAAREEDEATKDEGEMITQPKRQKTENMNRPYVSIIVCCSKTYLLLSCHSSQGSMHTLWVVVFDRCRGRTGFQIHKNGLSSINIHDFQAKQTMFVAI